MGSDNYRILGAGILIGAFTVVVIWLLSGEASYNPERDFEQRGAPLIITQVPSAPSAAVDLQPLPIPSNAPQPLTEQPEELVITELATTLPVVPEQSPPQAVPEAEAASASVAPPAAESAAVAPAAAAELTPQQIEQAIARTDSDINNAINAIGSTAEPESYWRIDVASFRDPDRANAFADKLRELLQGELGQAEIFNNRGLRKRSNDYFYTVVIANLPDEDSARRLSVPIKEAYPDIRNPRIREIKP